MNAPTVAFVIPRGTRCYLRNQEKRKYIFLGEMAEADKDIAVNTGHS